MKRGNNRNTKAKIAAAAEKDEVEEMLQAAQDDLLMKLSVDSHMSHRRVSHDDDDINRRFHALKLKTISGVADAAASKSKSNPTNFHSNSNSIQVDEALEAVLGDDLSARFAALKSSLPTATATPSSCTTTAMSSYYYDDSDDEEDEVEKLMRWAKDAARLDPSPPSDSDDDQDKSESDSDTGGNNRKGNRIGPICK